MKRLLLLLFALPAMAMGQGTEAQTKDSLSLIKTIYYERDQYISTEQDREELKELIFKMRADSTIRINVIGFGDKWGGDQINDRVSYVRAMYIGDWIRSCRVPREQINYVGAGIDVEAKSDSEARRVEVSQVFQVAIEPEPTPEPAEDARAAEPIEDIDTAMQVEPEAEATPEAEETAVTTTEPEIVEEVEITFTEPEEAAEPTTEPEETAAPTTEPEPEETAAPTAAPAQECQRSIFDIRTNLLYFAGGMFNVGAQYRPDGSSFGYLLNLGYSPFGGVNWEHGLGGWFVSPEVRYYFPSSDHWFAGVQLLAGGYNIKLSDTGYQGSVIGGGVMGGYKIELTKRFDMDFTLGVGYGSYNYDTYRHVADINVISATGLHKGTLLPQAGVNLIWKIK